MNTIIRIRYMTYIMLWLSYKYPQTTRRASEYPEMDSAEDEKLSRDHYKFRTTRT